jgi:hypothetical protein
MRTPSPAHDDSALTNESGQPQPSILQDSTELRRRIGFATLALIPVAALVTAAVMACGVGGTTTSSSSGGSNSSGVDCSYSETSTASGQSSTASWSCTSTERLVTANDIPDHSIGTFPNSNCPNTMSAQSYSWYTALSPTESTTSTTVAPTGYALNGVKFDPATAGTCPSNATSTSQCSLIGNSGAWNIEALGQSTFNFGVDSNNAHVQPSGAYHYHGMPTGILSNNNDGGTTLTSSTKMLLVGWAQDGFPIYARWGYTTATSSSSALKVMVSSWQVKTTPDSGRPSTSVVPMGVFTQDYQYVASSGDLDACNGRFDVTPEYPSGIYHYYITDTWPFIPRCAMGTTFLDNKQLF